MHGNGSWATGGAAVSMKKILILELSKNEDARGWLAEAWRSDGFKHKPAMLYVSCTKKGVVRGPHEHIRQTDVFVFLGAFRIFLWDNRQRRCEKLEYRVPADKPTLVVVPPGVVHAYKSLAENGIVMNLPDKLYRGKGKRGKVDEIRHEDDPNSPYLVS